MATSTYVKSGQTPAALRSTQEDPNQMQYPNVPNVTSAGGATQPNINTNVSRSNPIPTVSGYANINRGAVTGGYNRPLNMPAGQQQGLAGSGSRMPPPRGGPGGAPPSNLYTYNAYKDDRPGVPSQVRSGEYAARRAAQTNALRNMMHPGGTTGRVGPNGSVIVDRTPEQRALDNQGWAGIEDNNLKYNIDHQNPGMSEEEKLAKYREGQAYLSSHHQEDARRMEE